MLKHVASYFNHTAHFIGKNFSFIKTRLIFYSCLNISGKRGFFLVLKSAYVDCFQPRVDVNVPLQKGGSQPDLHVQFPLPGSHVS